MSRFLIIAALALGASLVVLWHEIRAPVALHDADDAPPTRDVPASLVTIESHVSPEGLEDVLETATAARSSVTPVGGVRAWSPTATPTGGPDPFAPVRQIRTAEDTRAGLGD